MSAYLIINLAIIIFPLMLSFEKQIQFYKKIPRLIAVFFTIGATFIFWDIIATGRGDWSFSRQYVGNTSLFGLPIEEMLFFVTVLYSTMFTFEVIKHYLFERKFKLSPQIFYFLSVITGVTGLVLIKTPYTSTALLTASLTLFVSGKCFLKLVSSIYYWIFLAVSLVLFFIFNSILTSLPIVMYKESAILGFRVFTIPIEDFIYNYSLLTLYLGIYYLLGGKEKKSKK